MLVDLLFERFVSTERDEPPDIYQNYGRHRAGLTASVITYRSEGAIRDVAKAFGLSEDTIRALGGLNWGWGQ